MIQTNVQTRSLVFLATAVSVVLSNCGYGQMPYAPCPPPYPAPYPAPYPVPGPPMMLGMPAFAIAVGGVNGGNGGSGGNQVKRTTTTTTTTTTTPCPPQAIAIAFPMMPMPPPPPPPMPMPIPMPMMPAPMVFVPPPPPPPPPCCPPVASSREHNHRQPDKRRPGSNWERRSLQRRKSVRARNLRKSRPQPYLSYISNDGDIRYKTRLTNNEADKLLDERARGKASDSQEYDNRRQNDKILNRPIQSYKNMNMAPVSNARKRAEESMPNPEADGKSQSGDTSNSEEYRKTFEKHFSLGDSSNNHQMPPGKKEIVFNAPKYKKITNLTIAFDIN